jgi:hypothetical protein
VIRSILEIIQATLLNNPQGLLPVTEEDIQQPEGNELASLDLLLDAANQVVVEVDQA